VLTDRDLRTFSIRCPMSKITYMTLLCACVLLILENSKSEWTRICRPGGDILSLVFSGNTLYGAGSAPVESFAIFEFHSQQFRQHTLRLDL
jgi:hypothetical protein